MRNRHSIIHFNALVSINAAKNSVTNERIEVMISFDNYNSYGEVKFLTGDLDPYLFPTVFEAKWNKMEQKTDHLLISDIHTKNSDIGKYEVRITPLEKIRD
ncbi:hypothetical protein ACSIGC_09320 [Tenacibaculum sp. ZS6-P6]|uniref:hypothetical protein n=1 Tax=Tenacibaculum sp. ZS6-P6 TaxID=3447503 RepID=UPI003F9D2341